MSGAQKPSDPEMVLVISKAPSNGEYQVMFHFEDDKPDPITLVSKHDIGLAINVIIEAAMAAMR